ncbi:glycoside hydrolase family 2 protein [Paenibacillus alba]|uniref:Glycoside hydrolase family 2 TIM barrel-domain containing protein n=1 Tax=Paenibacillus alba TaxID=1197127 RepID=A0ABU6GCC6_9BACL|nr:sugar-binding domain-containing protein [Paenibacillus alba]MEC0230428.1 glycoside hydrolase family 2 TIM barrel-domain containing protein [Paenibacillus alba]
MSTKMYIKDYPRPQFVRESWHSLNGEWDFRFDDENIGENEKWFEEFEGDLKIMVPFTYETKASGIGEEAFHPQIWYHRLLEVQKEQESKRIILHFQAVDYIAKLWVNGTCVGQHQGGYAAFSFDITPYIQFGQSNSLVMKVEDSQSCTQPRGKQRWVKDNFECFYVQTTGIWQSVWLEFVAESYIKSVKMTPDLDSQSVRFEYQTHGELKQGQLRLETRISYKGKILKQTALIVDRPWLQLEVDLLHEANGPWKVIKWSPQNPNLYDVEFVLFQDGVVIDHVYSYFGMRKISIEKGKVLLNNMPIYQRLILDQGYWSDSHLTPPSEQALIEDIDAILAMGYNGVRKHMKIEDARFLYWCDVKGLLVWSEMAATFEFNDEAVETFTKEWIEIVRQQYNHPSIITWVPFNESWGIMQILTNRKQQNFTEGIYHLTKSMDPSRPVITNDGWEHTVSDIVTLHDYVENGSEFLQRYADKSPIVNNEWALNNGKYALAQGYTYRGQPIIISEFGGIAFQTDKGWGYGKQVVTEEAFIERFRSITQAIKDIDYICGYCYTQVTDVQQEMNGLLTEDRRPKIPLELIKEINLA